MEIKPGEEVVIDGVRFIGNAEGKPVLISGGSSKKVRGSKWENVRTVEVPYERGKYEVAEVKDLNTQAKIVTIRQWVMKDGKSVITNKAGEEIPKKNIPLTGDKKVLTLIAKAIVEMTK